MSAVVLFVLFFVILLFGLPISVTMGISSILPWVVDNTFAANLVNEHHKETDQLDPRSSNVSVSGSLWRRGDLRGFHPAPVRLQHRLRRRSERGGLRHPA